MDADLYLQQVDIRTTQECRFVNNVIEKGGPHWSVPFHFYL